MTPYENLRARHSTRAVRRNHDGYGRLRTRERRSSQITLIASCGSAVCGCRKSLPLERRGRTFKWCVKILQRSYLRQDHVKSWTSVASLGTTIETSRSLSGLERVH